MSSGTDARSGETAHGPRAELDRAVALHRQGQLEAAADIYGQLLERDPDHADALHLLGLVRNEQGRTGEALGAIRRAVQLRPGAGVFHHNLAGVLRREGELGEAERHFREALRLCPGHAPAYQGLAELRRFEPGDPVLDAVEAQLGRAGLADTDRSHLHFAAGKILDDMGEPGRAFAHYGRGNRLAGKHFDLDGYESFVREMLFAYPASSLATRSRGASGSELPVFVVGMPRSGTSLVEQILASHSRVYGAGELPDLHSIAAQLPATTPSGRPFPACRDEIPDAARAGMARTYLGRLRELSGGDGFARVVDKHPLNFRYLGLVAELFPRARIVHIRRDARDTCLSCYFQNFTKGQEYSFDLATLGRFYRLYERLMEHWCQVLPAGQLLELDYEALVADQEAVSRRLIEFCGLAWEPACLRFQRTARPVRTASAWQVRQPLYKTSVARWKRYAPFLAALLGSLGKTVSDQPTRAERSSPKVKMRVLHRSPGASPASR